jgi:hypothetical protein
MVPRRQPEPQNEQAWYLTVVTNAVTAGAPNVGLAVGELRTVGREVDAEVLAHISPARSSVFNYYGSITVDYEHEPAQLDERGHRPLRTVAVDEPGAGLQPPSVRAAVPPTVQVSRTSPRGTEW